MFKALKRFLLASSIKKSANLSNPISFESAQNIGILFTCNKIEDFEFMMALKEEFGQQNKTIQLLGFYPKSNLQSTLHVDYIKKEDLNWFKKPNSNKIKNFYELSFDLLINLDITENLSLDYIVSKSNGFKIAAFHPNNGEIYDFMIKCKDKSVSQLVNNLKLYLN